MSCQQFLRFRAILFLKHKRAFGVLSNVAVVVLSLFLFHSFTFSQDATINVNRILIDDSVHGETPDVSSGSFSVGVRVSIIRPGNEPGNGDRCGMIFSVATGWYDGFRAFYDWKNNHVVFQIGRVQEKSAITVQSQNSVGIAVLHDIVCVYDAPSKKMTLYVDGENAGSADFDCPIVTQNAPLSVGFGGAGIGSNVMFVDKLEYWKRALTPDDIAARFAQHPQEEIKKIKLLASFPQIGVASDINVDDELYEAMSTIELPEPVQLQTEINYITSLLAKNHFEKAASLTFQEAEKLLNFTSVENEDPNAEIRRLNHLANIVFVLQKFSEGTDDIGETIRSKANRLLQSLRQKYTTEFQTFNEIAALEKSADRVRQIEKDALERFRLVCDTLEKQIENDSAKIIRVSPNGDDTADGSENHPVVSLARAFEIARQTAKPDESTGTSDNAVLIELADGVYRVNRPAAISNVENIVVRPVRDATVLLTGSVELHEFLPLKNATQQYPSVAENASRFTESSRNKIFVCDLAKVGIEDPGTFANRGYGTDSVVHPIPSLYVNGESQTVARWPNKNEEPLKFGNIVERPDENSTTTFQYDFDRVDRWKSLDDIWAFGLFQWEWAANFRHVSKIDRDARTFTIDYAGANNQFHYYFVNILEEVDTEGEFYIDRANRILYFYPPENLASTEQLAKANIEIDLFSKRFIDVENSRRVLFQNIKLRGGRESGISFKNCIESYFTDGKIEQFGGNAALIKGGSFCGVLNSRLRELGAGGVLIESGNRSKIERCYHLLHNCYISDFSRIDRVYTPAVKALGCGIAVTNNLISDSPHHGMRTDGNDFYIARNEVHSVVYEFSDQSGIDIYCDPTYRGIVIEDNLWQHIGSAFALCGQAGIRLDDSISGVVMKNNFFYRSSGGFFGGIQIHGGKDNLCIGNFFADCKQAFSFSVWSPDRYQKFVKEQFPENVENQLYLDTYPFFMQIFDHPNRNYIIDNTAINCEVFNVNGNQIELFVANRCYRVPEPDANTFLTDSGALRAWLEKMSGRSLKHIGLLDNWTGVDTSVSPEFTGIR